VENVAAAESLDPLSDFELESVGGASSGLSNRMHARTHGPPFVLLCARRIAILDAAVNRHLSFYIAL